MAEKMPSTPLQRIENLEAATREGAAMRASLRRRATPGENYRESQLRLAIGRLAIASALVRSDLGRLQWNPALDRELGERMREASRRGQLERRKLRKMLR